jgi:hypothetical protein
MRIKYQKIYWYLIVDYIYSQKKLFTENVSSEEIWIYLQCLQSLPSFFSCEYYSIRPQCRRMWLHPARGCYDIETEGLVPEGLSLSEWGNAVRKSSLWKTLHPALGNYASKHPHSVGKGEIIHPQVLYGKLTSTNSCAYSQRQIWCWTTSHEAAAE